MATPRSFKHALFVIVAAGVTAVGLFPASSTKAEPSKSLAEVQREVDALNAKLDGAIENYNQARIQLSAASRRTAAAERLVAKEQKAVEAKRKSMSRVAIAAYRSGGANTILTLVTTKDPQSFLDRASSLDQISGNQADALTALRTAQVRLQQVQAVADQELSKQQAVAKQLKAQKDGIEATLAQQSRLLSGLKADERARLAAAAAARSRAARAQHATYNGPASGAAAVAVRFAYNQLGKPYSWGASGPGSYDCSGLTMASWGAAGVSLPHSSSAQYGSGRHVSRSELKPGDLVFYGNPIHHVGIYIGNGNYIHAPHSGDVVSIDPAFRDDYAGAVRP
ncbi:MAG: peptidoglycan DL-endopeptidase CwlO [Frankiales bacterium]|nr:peptidoglycan DL-endopeptidase CwlO [Frankiales bacterium]